MGERMAHGVDGDNEASLLLVENVREAEIVIATAETTPKILRNRL
jgi:hypothetical protein